MDTDADALYSLEHDGDGDDIISSPPFASPLSSPAATSKVVRARERPPRERRRGQRSLSSAASTSPGIFSQRRPLDFSLLFLTWLCLSLVCSPAMVSAGDRLPDGMTMKKQFHLYYPDVRCTVLGGQCCDNMDSIDCQGWFCIDNQCAIAPCDYCMEDGDEEWFCGPIQGANHPLDGGMGCKRKAFLDQTCNNQTMPCQKGYVCGMNSTCEFMPEEYVKYEQQLEARRLTMVGMLVVLLVMFIAMRRMLKNEEARRRQLWEPVDSSAEASILRRLAEDTQRRLAGGWDQLNGSIAAGSNAASQAVGSALTRIRQTATGRGNAADDCEDVEMLPNERQQTRRELEEDMRAFMLEADEDEDEDLWDDDEGRDEDGLLSRNRRPASSNSGSSTNTASSGHHHQPQPQQQLNASDRNSTNGNNNNHQSLAPPPVGGYSDEPPSYDAVLGGEERRSMSSTLLGTAPVGSSPSTTTTAATVNGPIDS